MLNSLVQAFKVPELRNKILFTLGILALYRLGAYIPVPGIPFHAFADAFSEQGVGMAMLDLFTGGALSNFSVFALGIMPYITASIIMQLMQGVIPAIGRWAKEGETGRRKITQITRYLTLGLGLINAIGYLLLFKSPQYGVVFSTEVPEILTDILVVFTLVAGTAFIMWMGELITQRGIGNGMSLIIFVSIVSRVPSAIFSSATLTSDLGTGIALTIVILAVVLVCIPLIIFVERAQRRIPVNYAKRVQGRKMMGGQSTYIPLKVNAAGVIPIIFASSIMSFPSIILSFVGKSDIKGIGGTLIKMLNSNNWFDKTNPVASLGLILYIVLVIFFAYFYTSITFNPMEVADNMKKQGGFIPGIRPGKSTVDYLNNLLSYIIFIGAAGLTIVAVIPFFFNGFFKANVSFGGTSLIIIASVILETLKQIESMMLVRNYKGFLND